jgi:hypothetical protein
MTPTQQRTIAKLADSTSILLEAVLELMRAVPDKRECIELAKASDALEIAKDTLEEIMES